MGACLALNVEKWLACLMEICTHHNLPLPIDDEKFPVGTGSNPVFLVSDYVIKIFVEGGLGSSVHGLGTELEFYSLLTERNSPLMNHIPDIIASGFVVADGTSCRTFSWDGRAMPDMIANSNLVIRKYTADGFPFGIWSKKQFEFENHGVNMCSRIWPFIVSRQCKGEILANLRDSLSKNEVIHLASFLGEQLRHLRLLPLQNIQTHLKEISAERKIQEYSVGRHKLPRETDLMDADCKGFDTSKNWELLIALLDRRKKNINNQLAQWGDPIPGFLIDEVEKYIPQDLSTLFGFRKGDDGSLKCITSPTWIHSDIMDDNIHMKQFCPSNCFNECSSHTSSKVNSPHDACGQGDTDSTMNGVNGLSDGEDVAVTVNSTLNACNGITNLRRWCPSHILDFSDLSIGDPLCDLIPIYLDVFRGDMCLMNKLLEQYNLPLITRKLNNDELSSGLTENDKFKRLSYRAMCYCILHEDNVLGAIFSLWKELRTAKSWEEVEEAVWGGLNNYQKHGSMI